MIMLTALVCALCGVFGLVACGDGDSDEAGTGGNDGINSSIAVQSVELNKTELTLEIGGEETLSATVVPDNATEKSVKWSVSPAGIVTVDNGKVTNSANCCEGRR